MSFMDNLKKGLFGSEDEYDDQYIDDGPQMVNNNNGFGVTMDEEDPTRRKALSKRMARWSTSMLPPSCGWCWSSLSILFRMRARFRIA